MVVKLLFIFSTVIIFIFWKTWHFLQFNGVGPQQPRYERRKFSFQTTARNTRITDAGKFHKIQTTDPNLSRVVKVISNFKAHDFLKKLFNKLS